MNLVTFNFCQIRPFWLVLIFLCLKMYFFRSKLDKTLETHFVWQSISLFFYIYLRCITFECSENLKSFLANSSIDWFVSCCHIILVSTLDINKSQKGPINGAMIFRKDRCSQGLLLVIPANVGQLVGGAGIFFQEPTNCSKKYFKVHLKEFDMSFRDGLL